MKKSAGKARAVGVGIDVSKRELVVHVSREGGASDAFRVPNDEAGARRLVKSLAGVSCRIVLEATSHYGWLAAVSLVEAGMDARVINPVLTAKYSKGSVRKVKSDPADAATLARMAEAEPGLPPRFSATREALAWRKEYVLCETVKRKCRELRTAVAGAREAAASVGAGVPADLSAVEAALRALDAAARKAEKSLAEAASALSGGLAARLETVPGVSASAAGLACQLLSVGEGRDAKSWVAFAGLDVQVRQSGSWSGKVRLTKRGSPALRHRLFCCAWGAVRNDAAFSSWYDELRKAGRAYSESLVIIARKIVRTMFAIASTPGAEYDEALAFPPKKQAAA